MRLNFENRADHSLGTMHDVREPSEIQFQIKRQDPLARILQVADSLSQLGLLMPVKSSFLIAYSSVAFELSDHGQIETVDRSKRG